MMNAKEARGSVLASAEVNRLLKHAEKLITCAAKAGNTRVKLPKDFDKPEWTAADVVLDVLKTSGGYRILRGGGSSYVSW